MTTLIPFYSPTNSVLRLAARLPGVGLVMLIAGCSTASETAMPNSETSKVRSTLTTHTDDDGPIYGRFGSDYGQTMRSAQGVKDKWVHFATTTLTGAWKEASITADFFPRNPRSSNVAQRLIVSVQNSHLGVVLDLNGTVVSLSELSAGSNHPFQDVRVLHVNGSGVSNNVVEIWLQLARDGVRDVPFEARLGGAVKFDVHRNNQTEIATQALEERAPSERRMGITRAGGTASAGYFWGSNAKRWIELAPRMQGRNYNQSGGVSRRFEIEVRGGRYGGYGKVTYYVESRNSNQKPWPANTGLRVMKYVDKGEVPLHELRVYEVEGTDDNSLERYVIGFWLGTPEGEGDSQNGEELGSKWWSIEVRAREIGGGWIPMKDFKQPPGSGYRRLTENEIVFNQPFTISADGNLGLGVANPSAKLSVAGAVAILGKIEAQEFEVKTDVMPDFVFKDDYKLMSLSELRTFIQKHHHLPGVPSEAEVKKNGLKIVEMQKKLLQKIEENTLYLIQLHQENQRLRALLDAKN